MRFEEDYIMRIIKDMVKALACVIFGKRFTEYEVEEEKADDTDFLYRDIIEMADKGKINEAENILLTDMDQTDKRYMEMAMSFYLHINQLAFQKAINKLENTQFFHFNIQKHYKLRCSPYEIKK